VNASPLLRVVVCGANFGRFYAEAARDHPGLVLAGILTRGSPASRAYAKRLGVPHYTDIDALPQDIDAACVAVSSSISGGTGTDLAKALMGRGIHVLQEHPVHLDELTECLKTARRHRVQYRLNTHYPHVEPVREFIRAARRLIGLQKPLFVDAATPIHLLYPMVDILGQALGSLRPWRFADPTPLPDELGEQPFRLVQGVLGGTPLTLRVHHQLDPSDRDNHALHWHRMSVGTQGGVLTLADTHGPVLWSPRLHVGRDADHRFVLDGPGTEDLALTTTSVVGDTGTFGQVFTALWPQAVGRALDGLRDAVAEAGDPLRSAQYDLAVCRIWSDLAARLGPPEIVRPPAPHPLPAGKLFPDPFSPDPFSPEPCSPERPHEPTTVQPGIQGAGQPTSYGPSAEFFDLVAGEHTATGSAPAVVRALTEVDLSHGPVVDIGAGTGLVMEAVARALPGAEILASEPATAMRAVLTSRVFSDPDLRQRVTVTSDAAPELDLPDSLSAVLLCGVLGHLDSGQRQRLWARVMARLAPEGVVIVELMGLETPVVLPPARTATARAGHHRYEWWFSGAPDEADPSAMRLHSTWAVYRDDEDNPLREVRDSYRWIPFGLRQVTAESGLHARLLPTRPGSPPLAALTRHRPQSPAPTSPSSRRLTTTKEH